MQPKSEDWERWNGRQDRLYKRMAASVVKREPILCLTQRKTGPVRLSHLADGAKAEPPGRSPIDWREVAGAVARYAVGRGVDGRIVTNAIRLIALPPKYAGVLIHCARKYNVLRGSRVAGVTSDEFSAMLRDNHNMLFSDKTYWRVMREGSACKDDIADAVVVRIDSQRE